MADSEGSGLDLTQVLERFPHHAPLIRGLAFADDTFWSICEDYGLARTTLAKLQAVTSKKQDATKIAEYAALVADLEREIMDAVRCSREKEGGDR